MAASKVKAQMDKWKNDLEAAENRNEELTAELAEQKELTAKAQETIADLQRKLLLKEEQLDDTSLADAHKEVQEAHNSAQSKIEELQRKIQLLQQELETSESLKDELDAKAKDYETRMLAAEANLKSLSANQDMNADQLDAAQAKAKEIEEAQTAAELRAENAERKVTDMERQLAEAEEQIEKYKEEAEAAKAELAETLKELGIE